MIRREARLRREYLYRKSLEEQERALFEKKSLIKKALQDGTPIPKNLREEAQVLSKELVFDPNTSEPTTHVDDEYATASLRDPKLVITTSRDPSSRLLQFAKELSFVFPNSQKINRGGYVISQLVQTCKDNDVTDLILIHEHRGVPTGLIICHLPYGPTAYFSLYNVSLIHDTSSSSTGGEHKKGRVSEAYPHLIFDRFNTSLGQRTTNILKYLFPIPKFDTKRIVTFSNNEDFISFRNHTYSKEDYKKVGLAEIGPRFEMKLYQIKLGTVDIVESDIEWVLKPYMNSSKTRDVL